jgi:hypothetical protein
MSLLACGNCGQLLAHLGQHCGCITTTTPIPPRRSLFDRLLRRNSGDGDGDDVGESRPTQPPNAILDTFDDWKDTHPWAGKTSAGSLSGRPISRTAASARFSRQPTRGIASP